MFDGLSGSPLLAALPRRRFLQAAGALGGTVALTGCAPSVAPASPADGAVPADAVELTGDTEGYNTTLLLLGTGGGPTAHPGRTGVSSAVTVGGRPYLVDAGSSAYRRMAQAGIGAKSLGGVFVTHMHSDHLADLFTIFLLNVGNYMAGAPETPTPIFGPGHIAGAPHAEVSGMQGMLQGVLAAWAHEIDVRNAEAAKPVDYQKVVVGRDVVIPDSVRMSADNPAPDMDPFPVFEDDRVRVTGILVPHGAALPGFAYRFDTDNGSVTFSGDTARSSNVARLATGTDILVHEAIDIDYYKRNGFPEDVLEHHRQTHTSPDDVGRVATEAGAKKVVLNHLAPGDPRLVTDDEWVSRVSSTYAGPVVAGRDLTAHGVGPHS
ncbi:possible hydrolase (plasmid) [Rhodococcus jostii RHA1]|uniref:Possible hydrolase n=1 Tax=Rhodococcus jostii (strain RHA1) TaxID=101510 RepID=Q0RV74_RHOJR|nr:MBL fold metallo-hydrolase [Rhodococcus jostii]ABH00812.1 possible hydrolase [Rhodococcus jostii RHA1]